MRGADDEARCRTQRRKGPGICRAPGREQVADDGERDRKQRAGAEALDAAEEDQLPMVWLKAERAEPIRKITMPIMKMGLRP